MQLRSYLESLYDYNYLANKRYLMGYYGGEA